MAGAGMCTKTCISTQPNTFNMHQLHPERMVLWTTQGSGKEGHTQGMTAQAGIFPPNRVSALNPPLRERAEPTTATQDTAAKS